MAVLLLIHALLGALVLGAPRLGRRACLLAAAGPALTVAWLAARLPGVLDGDTPTESLTWVPELGLTLVLRLDALGWVMGALIAGVGTAVLVYASRYLDDGPGATRLAGLLTFFAAAMLGLVWSDQVLGLFVFWEATTVVSFLLVGYADRRADARAAAWQALLVTGAGGLALLFGLVVLGIEGGTGSLEALAADPPVAGAAVAAAAVGVLTGAFTKSAQVPAHGWLLGAMAAPTPVSAYLHSATMVAAGVWLVIRLDPVLAGLDWWHPALLVVGGVSALWGGWRALTALDLKRLLAYSTISALGVMFALVGVGSDKALFAAVAVLVAHALYKAALFMGVGVIDHQCGTRDLRALGGLAPTMPATAVAMALAALSMAAVPATAGFVSKEAGVVAALDRQGWAGPIGAGILVGAGLLAVAYGWRLWAGAFGGDRPSGLEPRRPTLLLWAPGAVLATVGVVLGVAPVLWTDLVADAAAVSRPGAGAYELVAWPGLGDALAVSLATLVAGAVVAFVRADRRSTPGSRTPIAFEAVLTGLFRFAARVTGAAQPGSLPVYVAVVLGAAVVPGAALVVLAGDLSSAEAVVAESPAQVVTAAVVLIAAVGVAVVRNRLAAVVALGAVGYAVAGLFWLQGAPDLALTQVLVETVVVAAFVLVFRRLPSRFRPRPRPPVASLLRLLVAGGVAASVLVVVVATSGPGRLFEAPTGSLVAEAEPVGGGRNVVNVVLTDVRALDTMGEVTVVAAAAIGALALAGLARRRLGAGPRDDAAPDDSAPRAFVLPRSIVLDALVRGVVPLVATFSLFMLFAGHNAPGGGFIAGLIAAAAIALRLLTGDWAVPRDRPLWLQPQPLIGLGLLIAVATLVAGGFAGGFGDQTVTSVDLPLLGTLKLTTALLFDLGVYLAVIGATAAILDALAAARPTSATDRAPVRTGAEP